MISSNDPQSALWADEPLLVEVAMRMYTRLASQQIVLTLEDEGWEPGELHGEMARRALAAAATFVDSLEALRAKRRRVTPARRSAS